MAKKDEEEQEVQDPMEALRAFVMVEKVDAFKRAYEPCESELGYDVVALDDGALRKLFDAYPKTMGDPLAVYVDEYLVPGGFRMKVSELTGQMVMLVRKKGW